MPSIFAVDYPDDPRIAAYRNVQERDLVGREGHFIAEGEVVLNVLLSEGSRHQAVSLLLAEKRIAALAPLLARLPDSVPVYCAAQPVLDGIAGFHLHRGILALGRRAPMMPVDQLLAATGRQAVIVMAFGIANHDNMGGIFRNAAAFGADAVVLDSHCCDPLYRKAIRVSVGAALAVPFTRLDADDPIALLAHHGFEAMALSPAGVTTLADVPRPTRTAVLLGTEGRGLPADILARCRSVRIPMAKGFDSLNVATTCGIVLHHLVAGNCREHEDH